MSHVENVSGIPTLYISSEEELKFYDLLVDVRRPDEYTGELGHIKGTKLVTLGVDLMTFFESIPKETKILFICRSGARSATATKAALDMGFTKSVNLEGGMIRWNEKKLKIEK